MNERDTEIASVVYGSQWTMQDMEFAALIRADAMETATRAANESWTLMCKKMVELEREACAVLAEKTICDTHIPTGINIYGTRAAKSIRARSPS